MIAEAASTALHPGTVEVGSWKVFDRGKELPKSAELEMLCDGPNTEEQPFLMEELGRDFFLRVHLTRKVVWFVCPATGEIYHSACAARHRESGLRAQILAEGVQRAVEGGIGRCPSPTDLVWTHIIA